MVGIWLGMDRAGWDVRRPSPELTAIHGPLLVFGFLGTLIGLERAVALRRRWGYAAPGLTIAAAAALLVGLPQSVGQVLLTAAGLVVAGLFAIVVRAHASASNVVLLAGAVVWAGSGAVWAWTSLTVVTAWWASFLVLTILGERLELAPLRGAGVFRPLLPLGLSSLALGLVLTLVAPGAGVRVVGASFVAVALWLVRFDVARRTVRRSGLPRFMGAGLLAGQVWLVVAGVVWLVDGAVPFGPRHDAAVHAVFLGFVMGMVFAHALVILPGVAGIRVPFHRGFYLPFGALHAGLALRVAGDLGAWPTGARWGALVNGVAIVSFAALAVATAAVSRDGRRSAGAR